MEEHNQRIKGWMCWCLIGAAATIDLTEALLTFFGIGLVLNPIISVGADVLFWIWFKILGVSFVRKPKNLAAMGIQAVIGLIPGADALPELTVSVIILVKLTQAEDTGGILAKASNATAVAQNPRKITNINSYQKAAPTENMRKAA